jgi:hypothetical protein
MKGVIFFAYLCFLLIRGQDNAYTYAGTPTYDFAYSRHSEKMPSQTFTNSGQEFSFIKGVIVNKEEELLISEEIEDDDDANSAARKYRLLYNGSLTLLSPYIFTYLHSFSKAPHSFSSQLSDKYLTQRVLRI